MTDDTEFISVRLPADVANWLREYANDNNLIRANKPNMGGSIIAVIRGVMSGQAISNNVGQSRQTDSNLDATLDNRIDAALEAKVDFSIRDISRVADEQYERLVAVLAQHKMDSDRETEALKLELETIKTAIAALTDKTTSESSSAPETEGSNLEPESLPIIEAIASTETDISKRMEVQEAYTLAKSRGCEDKITTFKDYRTRDDAYYAKFGLVRKANPAPKAKLKWFFFDTQTQS